MTTLLLAITGLAFMILAVTGKFSRFLRELARTSM